MSHTYSHARKSENLFFAFIAINNLFIEISGSWTKQARHLVRMFSSKKMVASSSSSGARLETTLDFVILKICLKYELV